MVYVKESFLTDQIAKLVSTAAANARSLLVAATAAENTGNAQSLLVAVTAANAQSMLVAATAAENIDNAQSLLVAANAARHNEVLEVFPNRLVTGELG